MSDDQEAESAATELDSHRLCGYSGCRAPLPLSTGPGNRPRYCQDGRTWGERNVTCKQAGHAEDLLASINAPVTPTPVATAELAERIETLLSPTRELVTALEQTREQLETETAEARRDRDEALRLAAEERGLREVAEAQAGEAERYASERAESADRAAAESEQAIARAAEADTARQQAEHARLRAEARAEELAEQLRRTEERLRTATGHAEEVDRRLAGATTEISELRTRLDEERQRSETERARADRALTDHRHQLEELRSSSAGQVAELRREHERAIAALIERHENTVAELHEQLGRRNQQLVDEQHRSERRRDQLTRWRSELAELVRPVGQPPDHGRNEEDPESRRTPEQGVQEPASLDLINRLQALLNDDSR